MYFSPRPGGYRFRPVRAAPGRPFEGKDRSTLGRCTAGGRRAAQCPESARPPLRTAGPTSNATRRKTRIPAHFRGSARKRGADSTVAPASLLSSALPPRGGDGRRPRQPPTISWSAVGSHGRHRPQAVCGRCIARGQSSPANRSFHSNTAKFLPGGAGAAMAAAQFQAGPPPGTSRQDTPFGPRFLLRQAARPSPRLAERPLYLRSCQVASC